MIGMALLREPVTYSKLKAVRSLIRTNGFCDVNPADRYWRDAKGEITTVKERRFPQHVPVDPEQVEKFKSDPLKYSKTHAGIIRLQKTVMLPPLLEDNLRSVLAEKECLNKKFDKECSRMVDILRYRQPPMEPKKKAKEYSQVLDKVLDDALKKEDINLEELSEKEQEKLSRNADITTKKIFAKTHYNWKPINYSGYNSLVYTAARLVPNYAVMLQVLQEIKRDNPDFVPDFVYNYGSGTGSAIWAAHTLWKDKVYEYFCTDSSRDMNRLAQKLMAKDIHDPSDSSINGVHFRMFPSSSKNRYSLVISGYLMTEMGSIERRELVKKLWTQTGEYLVLVENESAMGYKLIMEARDLILDMMKSDPELEGHVIAPCTHDAVCPKQVMKLPICNFGVTYADFPMTRNVTQNFLKQTEMYMYVIFKKGQRKKAFEYPRILHKRVSKGVNSCLMCCPDGEMHYCIVNKSTSDRVLVKSARKATKGDLLPVLWSQYNPDIHDIETAHDKKIWKYRTEPEGHFDTKMDEEFFDRKMHKEYSDMEMDEQHFDPDMDEQHFDLDMDEQHFDLDMVERHFDPEKD